MVELISLVFFIIKYVGLGFIFYYFAKKLNEQNEGLNLKPIYYAFGPFLLSPLLTICIGWYKVARFHNNKNQKIAALICIVFFAILAVKVSF